MHRICFIVVLYAGLSYQSVAYGVLGVGDVVFD